MQQYLRTQQTAPWTSRTTCVARPLQRHFAFCDSAPNFGDAGINGTPESILMTSREPDGFGKFNFSRERAAFIPAPVFAASPGYAAQLPLASARSPVHLPSETRVTPALHGITSKEGSTRWRGILPRGLPIIERRWYGLFSSTNHRRQQNGPHRHCALSAPLHCMLATIHLLSSCERRARSLGQYRTRHAGLY